MRMIRVALDLPLPRLFDYLSDDLQGDEIGRLARVPFGRGEKIGVVVGVPGESDQPADKLKPVLAILRDQPRLPAQWIALCEFCAQYYQYPLGAVMSFALPPMLRRGKLPRRTKPPGSTLEAQAKSDLLPEQRAAVDAIVGSAGFATFLLHGVTGSGKTEVYLQTIEACLARVQQALMLVPEIALTPQL